MHLRLKNPRPNTHLAQPFTGKITSIRSLKIKIFIFLTSSDFHWQGFKLLGLDPVRGKGRPLFIREKRQFVG